MTPEIITAISATVAILGFLVAFATYMRSDKSGAKEDGEKEGLVLARLDSIDDGIRDIKAENRMIRNEIKEVRDIAQQANAKAEAAHNRIDRAGIDTQR